jgi:hypothetical protein
MTYAMLFPSGDNPNTLTNCAGCMTCVRVPDCRSTQESVDGCPKFPRIRLPSGLKYKSPEPWTPFGTSAADPVTASTIRSARPLKYPIRFPSDDHAGFESKPKADVSRRISPPSRPIVQIAP